jgi:WD40 repeat protein
LKYASYWAQGKSLSDLDYHFLAAAVDCDKKEVQRALEAERSKAMEAEAKAIAAQLAEEKIRLLQEQKAAKLQRLFLGAITLAFLVSSGLGVVAFQQYREARVNEIKALTSSSESLLLANRQLDAIIAAIQAKRKLENLPKSDRATIKNVEKVLNQAVYGSYEFNLLRGHKGSVTAVNISPNLQLIATGAEDQTVRIWQSDGTLLHILKHSGSVWRVMFSPDSRLLVTASLDGTVKIWMVDGKLIKSFKAHQSPAWGLAISPNGKLIASSSADGTIKLWNVDGQLLNTFIGHQSIVRNVTFIADSRMIASAG